MSARETTHLGCYCDLHIRSFILSHSITNSRFSCRAGCSTQGGQVVVHVFEPIAFETLEPMNPTAATLLCDPGRRAITRTNETRQTSFLL